MRLQPWKPADTIPSRARSFKYAALFLFLLLSILIVACDSQGNTSQAVLGAPAVTVTLRLGNFDGSPTPPLPAYACGAWATETSPAFHANGVVSVYAKFVQNNNGNPEGIGDASATATIHWPDSTTDMETVRTTSDGLAVFPIALRASAINAIVLVDVTFSKPGIPPCTVPQAAYFTAMVAPTMTMTPGSTRCRKHRNCG